MTRKMPFVALLCCAVLLGCATSSPPPTAVAVSGGSVASVEVFYGALSPYGEWVYINGYGRVWRPSIAAVGVGFRPYGPGGHWVYTDYGWSFESEWSWGWAPFHYGRWYLDSGYGWVWVPGTAWAPAWVSWRYGGGYAGWAPLPPVGSTIVIETYHPYWCFVETRYLVVHDVYHYAMPVQSYHAAFSATVTVQQSLSYGGTRWNAGPPASQVSREIGQPIHAASVTPPPAGAVQAHRVVPASANHSPGAAQPTAHAAGAHPADGAHPSPPGPHNAGPGAAQHAPPQEGAASEAHSARSVEHEGSPAGREGEPGEHEGHERGQHHEYSSPEHGAAKPPPPPPAKKKRR